MTLTEMTPEKNRKAFEGLSDRHLITLHRAYTDSPDLTHQAFAQAVWQELQRRQGKEQAHEDGAN